MPIPEQASQELAKLLCAAHTRQRPIASIPGHLLPDSSQQAYLIQQQVLHQRQETAAGWKVGAKTPGGQVQAAPLPASGVLASPAVLAQQTVMPCGIELEIAFYFSRDFFPAPAPYPETEVVGSIHAIGAAVEIVASRLHDWPGVDRLLQLADLQNHGALILGETVPYPPDFPFSQPHASLFFEEDKIVDGPGANPAGDPRWLLTWLVNHCMAQGIALLAGTPVTTGSYTGMYFPKTPGVVNAEIAGLPPVQLALL